MLTCYYFPSTKHFTILTPINTYSFELLWENAIKASSSYNSIGVIYEKKGDNDKALEYLSKSLEIRKVTKNDQIIAAAIDSNWYGTCINFNRKYI